jgi:small subunit ribosomal protein S20
VANHKSAMKRIKQTVVRTERNKALRTRYKNIVKSVIQATNKEEAQAAFKVANREIHRLVTKGLLKKETASRKVSRLSAFVKKIEA